MPDRGLQRRLLNQITDLRSRMDPKVLDRVRLAHEGKVPFDRQTAGAAVQEFLANRDDDGAFERRLNKAMAVTAPKRRLH